MPFGELKNLNLTKLLPMFPDRTVTHVPSLDPYRAATKGSVFLSFSGRIACASRLFMIVL
jgi:hypothetical protein